MNMLQVNKRAFLFLVAFTAGCVSAQAATTIAQWDFEGSVATIGNDSSGNGYNLVDPSYTVQYSTSEYAPGTSSTGSAYFDGASFLTTLSTVDLSAYEGQNLRLSFWMNNQTSQDANEYGGLGTIFETGSNFKSHTGGIYVGVNGTYTDCTDCGMASMMMSVDKNTDQLPHAIYTGGAGVWEHYAIEFRPGSTDAAEVTKIYKNGALLPDTAVNGDHDIYSNPNTFRNDHMFFGMRSSLPEYAFVGKLDDVQIFDGESGTLVAEWLFEDGAFLSDTSGNGNDLAISSTYTGVASSTDVMSGETGTSAYFDGNGRMATVSPLDLSDYNKLRVKYRVKNETTAALGIFMEQTTNAYTNNGAFILTVNEVEGPGCAGIQLAPGEKTDRNIELAHVTANEWIEYEITFDQTVDNYEDVIQIIKNGVLQADDTIDGRQGVPVPWDGTMAYPNEYVNIGARAGSILNFIGYIDEMKLEAFEDSAVSDLPGDANADGVVNAADAAALAANWMKTGGALWSEGDFNGDGNVNDIDATILATNWQVTSTSNSTVPEPGCLLLLGCGLISVVLRRRST